MWFRPWDGPQEVRILTDNVISLKYKGGAIEHWKVRLSAKDVEKNIEKYYRPDSAQPEWFYANECLLWRNGSVFSGTGGKVPKEMWCFRKGGPEPAPESYSDISYEKTVGRKDKAAALDAGEAKGFPALLPGMIKTFFAELFA